MIFPQIRCNYSATPQNPNVFYILCKGENAGKPSLPLGGAGGGSPWANSFVVICQHKQHLDFYFWLVNALFLSGKFKIKLRGSVIPFINIDDVREMLKELAPAIQEDWSRFRELVNTLDKLSKLKSSLAQQIQASENLQKALLQNFFSSSGKNGHP